MNSIDEKIKSIPTTKLKFFPGFIFWNYLQRYNLAETKSKAEDNAAKTEQPQCWYECENSKIYNHSSRRN